MCIWRLVLEISPPQTDDFIFRLLAHDSLIVLYFQPQKLKKTNLDAKAADLEALRRKAGE